MPRTTCSLLARVVPSGLQSPPMSLVQSEPLTLNARLIETRQQFFK